MEEKAASAACGPEPAPRGDDARRAMLGSVLEQTRRTDPLVLREFVPQAWHHGTAIGLDGVVRIEASAVLGQHILGPVRAEDPDTADLLARARGFVGVPPRSAGTDPDGEACLDALEAVHALTCLLDAARLHAAGVLAARTGERLLDREGVAEPGELSRTRRERWRARAKSVSAGEVATLTGWGRGRSRELVAVALAPAPVRTAVTQGLQSGIVTWAQVEAYWRAARRLTPDGAAEVATRLLATAITPEQAHPDRRDPDGTLRTTPWPAQQYHAALAQEIARHRPDDPDTRRREPGAAHAARDVYGIIDDDGTGQVVIKGDAASTTACVERLSDLARRLRATGDPRSESALRADIARALLLHGHLALPTPAPGDCSEADGSGSELDDLLSPADLARIAQVVNGAPAYHLQVIVPWDSLAGRPVLTMPCGCGGCRCAGPGQERPTKDGPPTAPGEQHPDPVSVREGVGRVLGRQPVFLTGSELRAAALAPGTTLSRILFDHADGRCLERSLARYRPDKAMRDQIIAADVFSRGPGAMVPAGACQLDHVHPYGTGGDTTEGNLQAVDNTSHHAKTAGDWDAVINARRDVTWTTFWGRVYRTRVHDYRQYLTTGVPTGPGSRSATLVESLDDLGLTSSGPPNVDERRYLASLLTYAALTSRQAGERLEAPDDDPDSDTSYLSGRNPVIWIRHTRASDGAKVSGPHPKTPAPEQVIATPASTILEADHWTDGCRDIVEDTVEDTVDSSADGRDDEDPPPF